MDLENNDICNESGERLLTLVQATYFCEELNLKGNKQVNYAVIESIEDECRKNHLIKKYIAPGLKNIEHDSIV